MEFRPLGRSSLRVPAVSFGTATFGGVGDFYQAWGSTDIAEAQRLVDLCLDAGITMFDTANSYSRGRAEEILGAAIAGRRGELLLSTKAGFPIGDGPRDFGSSRQHLLTACDDSLRRLGTDHIDLYYIHGFDAKTPIEETIRALEDLVRSGRVGHIGCSNFSGWHVMKSLAVADRNGWSRYVAHQVYYSLVSRELEWELMPLALDEGLGSVVWSPLAAGALSGKVRRGQPAPPGSRSAQLGLGRAGDLAQLYEIVDALDTIAAATGRTVAQIALNWVLSRPTVSSVVIGARTEAQLTENIGALGWSLDGSHLALLNDVSARSPIYPYWHQRLFPQLGAQPIR